MKCNLIFEKKYDNPKSVLSEIRRNFRNNETPRDIVSTYSPDEFEEFIEEWVFYSFKEQYSKVYRVGGTGDMGQDIVTVCKTNPKKNTIYQCKHYRSALKPSDLKDEIVKVCLYSYRGHYSWPNKYYFIALNDLTSASVELLEDPNSLKEVIIDEWSIIVKRVTKKSGEEDHINKHLQNYLENVDFSIFGFIPLLKVIDDYLSTSRFAVFRFGRNVLNKALLGVLEPPEQIEEKENYAWQLLKIYGVEKEEQLQVNRNYARHFKSQRKHFFQAEELRVFEEKVSTPGINAFEKLKRKVYSHVVDINDFHQKQNKIEKVIEVTGKARELNLAHEGNILEAYVEDDHKHGICHHLVSEGEMFWWEEEFDE